MSEPGERAVDSVWWTLALVAGVVACGLITALDLSGSGFAARLALCVGLLAGYALLFLLVARRAAPGSARAWVVVVVTVIVGGVLTAIVPGNAVFQFWMYPLVWVLTGTIPTALIASFAGALCVFVGFAVSTGASPGWLASAVTTQVLSYGVNVGLGLWISSVYRYATERERLLDELTSAQAELAALHRHAGITSERERLARELHDTIAQTLAGTVLLVQRARRERTGDDGVSDETLALLEDSTRAALAETRALVAGNAPIELRGHGLADALRALADRFGRETGVKVALDLRSAAALDRETEVALLRCAQEALANVRAHADAGAVTISLQDATDAVELTVQDDGRGFDPQRPTSGFGLSGLRARLQLLGGDVTIDGTAGATTLRARIPTEGSSA